MDNTPPLSPTEKTHAAARLIQGQGQNISLRLVGKEVRVQRRNMKSDQICGGVECLGKLIKSSLGYQSISNYAAIQFGTHAIPIWLDPQPKYVVCKLECLKFCRPVTHPFASEGYLYLYFSYSLYIHIYLFHMIQIITHGYTILCIHKYSNWHKMATYSPLKWEFFIQEPWKSKLCSPTWFPLKDWTSRGTRLATYLASGDGLPWCCYTV